MDNEVLNNSKLQKNKRDSWMLQPDDSKNEYDFSCFWKKRKKNQEYPEKNYLDTHSKLPSKESDLSQISQEAPGKLAKPSYIIGDAGSSWRMMKLRKIYEIASETGKSVNEVALNQYGSLEAFYEALEEKEELERRKIHGPSKERVTGSLYKQYLQSNSLECKESCEKMDSNLKDQKNSKNIISTDIDMKKKKSIIDPDNMTIEDMVKEEKRTRNSLYRDQYKQMAKQIIRDPHFKDNLEYYDENAEKLSKRIQKREIDFRNINLSDFQRIQKTLDTCPLCHQDSLPPVAPVVSMGTRIYLSLPSPPELTKYHALIVPIHHRVNTLECDDDEWDEIRNFMKCLIRMADEQDHDVIFYENAVAPHRHMHTAIEAVPVPRDIAIQAPAFFREAILSSDEEWSQHQKIINTLSKAKKGLGKMAFRRSISKEAPYFHVWFEIDGGIGHIVENLDKWGKGDILARQVFATMLGLDPIVWKRRGRWTNTVDPRVKSFQKVWAKHDWTQSISHDE
ncbi:hypothetical protein PORY_000295 [Pneumocystis oryctolagi]|uniref:Uncharacterized protein n=1 Tax=Pneumocystis oryctolagi TaxID=42067 RepID=A0ACB7CGJ2_9ASCO|nr:hypothetical protein PORY_000295 [Pneumocystis oryctolagi]